MHVHGERRGRVRNISTLLCHAVAAQDSARFSGTAALVGEGHVDAWAAQTGGSPCTALRSPVEPTHITAAVLRTYLAGDSVRAGPMPRGTGKSRAYLHL